MLLTEKLDILMAERHINKSVLSKQADIPYTTIDGLYKKGSDNIKLSTLRRLAAYFNCTLDYLADNTSEKSPVMPLPKETLYTSEDYWNLPDGKRAELINGKLYDMAPPNRLHQDILFSLARKIADYIDKSEDNCKVYLAPFAVNLNADDKTYVEPDISIICDKNKLTDRGCSGAPDFIIEIVSPSNRKMDYTIKNALYSDAGVREYWIVDPIKECTVVYHYEEDAAPVMYPFTSPVRSGIYPELTITVADLLQ